MLISCPICGSGILKSLSTAKAIYLVQGNEPCPLGKSRAYSCGSNGHIVIVPANGNGQRQIPESHLSHRHISEIRLPENHLSETRLSKTRLSQTNGATPALVSSAREKEHVLNSWKEIATYMGRGVRTVQRWERELGLPVRRPRGKSRSAVIALAADLDQWLHCAPVGFEPDTSSVVNPEATSAHRLKLPA
jgi:DNA-binding transcriptional regulator YiaG